MLALVHDVPQPRPGLRAVDEVERNRDPGAVGGLDELDGMAPAGAGATEMPATSSDVTSIPSCAAARPCRGLAADRSAPCIERRAPRGCGEVATCALPGPRWLKTRTSSVRDTPARARNRRAVQ